MSKSVSSHKEYRNTAARMGRRYRQAMLESLESCTLMSVTVAGNGKSATFTDVDGDLVTVAVSKGTLTAGLFTTAASGLGEQLQGLDLTSAGFTGANVTISVKQTGTGDGLTNVGYINSTGHALGKVAVAGDLGRINAGSSPTSGLSGLTVFSMGRQGTSSQTAGGTLISTLTTLGALTITTDLNEAFINVSGNIGNVRVGGSLIGGTTSNSGSIQSGTGNIGNVFVGQSLIASNDIGAAGTDASASILAGGNIGSVTVFGSLQGGAADDSGEIGALGNMGKVAIGGDLKGGAGISSGRISAVSLLSINVNGSLKGGTGKSSGSINATKIGNIVVGGSLQGNTGENSGSVLVQLTIANVTINGSIVGDAGLQSGSVIAESQLNGTIKMGNVTIGGSVIGGSGSDTGAIWTTGNMGKVVVLGDLIGGDASPIAVTYTGYIEADGNLASVFIGGSVIAGTNSGTAGLLDSGYIHCAFNMGNVTVNGNLVGNATRQAIISSWGNMGVVSIGGRVDHAMILGGYDYDGTGPLQPVNNATQISKIIVSGDWIASSVVVGVNVGADTFPGTGDDVAITVLGGGAGTGKIGSIAIAGQVFGTGGGGDNFGFVASSIGSFSATGVKATLTGGKDTLTVPGTNDVVIKEV